MRSRFILYTMSFGMVILFMYIYLLHGSYQTTRSAKAVDSQQLRENRKKIVRTPSVDELIKARLSKMGDGRPTECRRNRYSTSRRVSVIIDFFDYQFYDLKSTISSVLQRSKSELLGEIIIIDDGSTVADIIKEAQSYISKIPLAQLIRNDVRHGNGIAKRKGIQIANFDILVFLDTNVICHEGWLEPLVELISKTPSVVAVPHFDLINDPVMFGYFATADNLITTFTWGMTMRMTTSRNKTSLPAVYDSPVMRGNAFAVNKQFFESIGAFDYEFEEDVGQIIELSLRTWMCGGSIKIVPCSRVGILNLADPVRMTSHKDIRRITKLWLDYMTTFVFYTTKTQSEGFESETASIKNRRRELQSLSCKSFQWYLHEMREEVVVPSEKTRRFGLLKNKAGLCARMSKDGLLDMLLHCNPINPGTHWTDMFFELTTDGFIHAKDNCLTTNHEGIVVVEPCQQNNIHQIYNYTTSHCLNNNYPMGYYNFSDGFCLMQVTYLRDEERQILMSQPCTFDTTENQDFSTWEFAVYK